MCLAQGPQRSDADMLEPVASPQLKCVFTILDSFLVRKRTVLQRTIFCVPKAYLWVENLAFVLSSHKKRLNKRVF